MLINLFRYMSRKLRLKMKKKKVFCLIHIEFIFYLCIDIAPQNSHKNGMLRKAALSDWLKNVVSSTTEKETNEHDFVFEILSLLSCRKIYEACECATLNGK